MKKSTMASKWSSVVGHFDGHGRAPEQYRRHFPIWHVQGYPGGHWTPPLGNYLVRIAPLAARATANKTTKKNESTLLCRANGNNFYVYGGRVQKYGTLRSLRYIYSNPFRFLISSLGLLNFPSQESWEGALAKYTTDNRTSTRQNCNSQ